MTAAARLIPRSDDDALEVGMMVYDRGHDLPAVIKGFEGRKGNIVLLERPTGFGWRARRVSVRKATAWERKQLRALAKLYRTSNRGVGPT
ncbi:hypothetical protein [Streptomyces sp. DG1A-41]|uniref:hypothetical protein n=1 Tax=Streptomyces sp. DG1A-41 TaxID=3125779 RepID=UPI0030D2DC0A